MENDTLQQGTSVSNRAPRFGALIPFIVFTVFYLGLSLWVKDFYKVSMPIAFLVASAVSMFLNHKSKLSERVEVFATGMGDVNIMIMCLIFILSGAFATVAKGMGAVDAAVIIARRLIPGNFMLTGIFLVSCFISLAIGTSCGTIAALTPIACGLIEPLALPPALLLGAVVGGAMFGDNLSMISDTTIAATRTQNVAMRDKFFTNIKVVIPALLITLALYVFNMKMVLTPVNEATEAITWQHLLFVLPYILILVFALMGFNVMMLLFSGTVLAYLIGIWVGNMDFWQCMDCAGKGALGMSETLIVAILAGGLLKVIRYNGGIDYLLKGITSSVKTPRQCEIGIMVLVSIVNLFTANNTVAIVIAGPIAKMLSDKYGCNPKRIASILDTSSCVIQGLIPYGAQILIAVGLATGANFKVSPLELIGALYYPMALAVSMIVSIIFQKPHNAGKAA